MAELYPEKGAILHTPSADELKLQFMVSCFDVFGIMVDSLLKTSDSKTKKTLEEFKKNYVTVQQRLSSEFLAKDEEAEVLSLDELEKREKARREELEAKNI